MSATMTAAQARALTRILKGQHSGAEIIVDGAPGWALTVEIPALAPAGSPVGPRWRVEPDGTTARMGGEDS